MNTTVLGVWLGAMQLKASIYLLLTNKLVRNLCIHVFPDFCISQNFVLLKL